MDGGGEMGRGMLGGGGVEHLKALKPYPPHFSPICRLIPNLLGFLFFQLLQQGLKRYLLGRGAQEGKGGLVWEGFLGEAPGRYFYLWWGLFHGFGLASAHCA